MKKCVPHLAGQSLTSNSAFSMEDSNLYHYLSNKPGEKRLVNLTKLFNYLILPLYLATIGSYSSWTTFLTAQNISLLAFGPVALLT